jgi:hypothetical protein
VLDLATGRSQVVAGGGSDPDWAPTVAGFARDGDVSGTPRCWAVGARVATLWRRLAGALPHRGWLPVAVSGAEMTGPAAMSPETLSAIDHPSRTAWYRWRLPRSGDVPVAVGDVVRARVR